MLLKCFGIYHYKHANSSERQYPTVIQELCHQFSLDDIRKSTNNFDENRVIGRGVFSQVYRGCIQHDGVSDYTVAVKRFYESIQGCEAFKKEIELRCQIHHPNCVSLIGFCNHKNEKILVFKYFSNGSLHQQLQSGELSWKKRLEICIGVVCGLHYLHTGAKRTIFHCILSPGTIILDDDMEPRLSGFGVSIQGSRFMSKAKQINVDHVIGTWGYKAMEYVMDGTITAKWDVFSFGLVLLEVVWGITDLEIRSMGRKVLKKPVEETIDPNIKRKIAPECWQVFKDVMVNCLKYEANERPTMGEIERLLEHALSLQEQADITNTNCDYTLLTKTIIPI